MQRLTTSPRTARRLRLLGAAAIILLSARPAAAQWQWHYGNLSSQIGTAVEQTSDGGFIAAGPGADSPGDNAYLVRTDANGNRIWDRRYYFGTSTTSTVSDVKVCANGDYILTGSVLNTTTSNSSLLAMRTDANGTIIWSRTIGDGQRSYSGQSVLEAVHGNGTTTNPGDIVIGGNTIAGTGDPKWLILRLSPDGDIIWNQMYDGGPSYAEATLADIVETHQIQAGDLAATGTVESVHPGARNVMVLRVDGNSGTIGASPQGVGIFDTGDNDIAFSIIERQLGIFSGDLVIAGSTISTQLGGYGVLAMEIRPYPADPAGPRGVNTLVDHPASAYIGYSVREITDPALCPNGSSPGDVVVGGMAYSFPNSYLGTRGFLQMFTAGSMMRVGFFHTYGDPNGYSEVRGITEITSAFGSPGIAMTGRVDPPYAINTDLWLARTDAALLTCGYETYPLDYYIPPVNLINPVLNPVGAPIRILCGIQSLETDWGNPLCSRSGPPTKEQMEPAPAPGAKLSMLSLQPNLLRQGESFTLSCTAPQGAAGEMVVSDIAGREVHRQPVTASSEAVSMTIGTDEWAPGTYLLQLTLDGTRRTGRITIATR